MVLRDCLPYLVQQGDGLDDHVVRAARVELDLTSNNA
jgi:hypothetical protein